MKIAVCFFGQPRYFYLWNNYNKELYKGCDLDFYAHLWGDNEIKNEIEKNFNTKKIIVEPQVDIPVEFPYEVDTSKISTSVFNTLSPLYSMNILHDLINNVDDKYDFWILTRTDIVGKGICLNELSLERDKIYTSYVPGDEWLTTHIDTKFICGNKNDILDITKIYSNLDLYLNREKISLCHHRLAFRALKNKKENIEMIILDPNDTYGGWFFIRNQGLSS